VFAGQQKSPNVRRFADQRPSNPPVSNKKIVRMFAPPRGYVATQSLRQRAIARRRSVAASKCVFLVHFLLRSVTGNYLGSVAPKRTYLHAGFICWRLSNNKTGWGV
jgi:hypothetical protein